ncbi:hypothetical protein PQO01_00480 [Lentisphaera marina]|uniref:3'-5' exonuclease n=1 Tax=Lentisphaera marina TaxID=1111041 RepID=UPI0023654DEC|nr:hypothetical protein [Lentisphaera marina]MDD7983428.1 hypothetical protein [Lentisphaera marina]
MLEFTAIDFETVPGEHGPIAAEIGLVVFNESGEILHYFEASAPVNDLYAASAHCCESIVSTWPKIKQHLQNKIILGHNIGYDYAILKKCFPALTIERSIDSLQISRQVYSNTFSDYSLTSLLECLDLNKQLEKLQVNDHFIPHRALYDAMGCALLCLHLLNKPKGRELIFPQQQSLF